MTKTHYILIIASTWLLSGIQNAYGYLGNYWMLGFFTLLLGLVKLKFLLSEYRYWWAVGVSMLGVLLTAYAFASRSIDIHTAEQVNNTVFNTILFLALIKNHYPKWREEIWSLLGWAILIYGFMWLHKIPINLSFGKEWYFMGAGLDDTGFLIRYCLLGYCADLPRLYPITGIIAGVFALLWSGFIFVVEPLILKK